MLLYLDQNIGKKVRTESNLGKEIKRSSEINITFNSRLIKICE